MRWMFAIVLFITTSASAQIYECRDDKGQRLWTNEPCADGKVLHSGVGTAAQQRAEQYERQRVQERMQENARLDAEFRQRAYGSNSNRVPARSGSKNLFLCKQVRRSIRIWNENPVRDPDRIIELRAEERRYC